MRLKPTFFVKVLVWLFVCVCNGAPPDEDGDETHHRIPFTPQEDQLIVDELSKIYDGTVSLQTKSLWLKIAKTFNEKWERGAPGFPKERSSRSLQNRLNRVLIFNDPQSTVKVPEDLLRKALDRSNEGGVRHQYTDEEHECIIKELFESSNKNLFGMQTLEAIVAELTKNRQTGKKGFNHVRTLPNIRAHLSNMKKKGLIPAAILEKYPTHLKGAGTSQSSTSRQTGLELTDEEQEDDDWAASIVQEFQNNAHVGETSDESSEKVAYTIEEDQLIVDLLTKLYDGTVSLNTYSFWIKVAEKFNENRKRSSSGYPKERTARSLQNRFNRVLIYNEPQIEVKVPDDLLEKYAIHRNAEGGTRHQYTEQEDNFIFQELLKPSYKTLFGTLTLEKLARKIGEKRDAGTFGFENERAPVNIHAHLSGLKKKDLIPDVVLEKFRKRERDAGTSTSRTTSQQRELQVTDEEDDEHSWASGMIREFKKKT